MYLSEYPFEVWFYRLYRLYDGYCCLKVIGCRKQWKGLDGAIIIINVHFPRHPRCLVVRVIAPTDNTSPQTVIDLSSLGLTTDRWSALAFARFLLASIVAVNHLAGYCELGALSWIPKFGAFEAILGFLLISGYSVTSSYKAKPNGFLARRLFRLYPVYLTSIVLTIFIGYTIQDAPIPSLTSLIINTLFLNQLLTNSSLVGPAWSLSLEF